MSASRILTLLLAIAGCLLVPNPLAAQLEAVQLHLGVSRSTMGGGFTELVESANYDVTSRTGFVAGASIDYALPSVHERLSFHTGLGLAQKGYRIADSDGDEFQLVDITYLEIPLLAKLSFGSGEWTPYAMAGPVLSLKQSSYGEVRGEEADADGSLKGSDVGIGVGLGARKDRLGAELRYVHGFPNVTTSDNPNESAKNRQWSLAVTYRIPLGG